MGSRTFSFAVFLTIVASLSFSTASAQRKPALLVQGTQLGKAVFPPGDTARGGNGQPVDGIEALEREMLKTHFHSHLAIFYKGEQIAIPYGIGIVKPFQVEDGFVGGGKAIYWIHTHDATGIIHVESPTDRTYTLGNFFDIWGEPLGRGNVAALRGKVKAYVDGKPYRGDPRRIPLGDHTEITLVVGTPSVTPPRYEFPEGL